MILLYNFYNWYTSLLYLPIIGVKKKGNIQNYTLKYNTS